MFHHNVARPFITRPSVLSLGLALALGPACDEIEARDPPHDQRGRSGGSNVPSTLSGTIHHFALDEHGEMYVSGVSFGTGSGARVLPGYTEPMFHFTLDEDGNMVLDGLGGGPSGVDTCEQTSQSCVTTVDVDTQPVGELVSCDVFQDVKGEIAAAKALYKQYGKGFDVPANVYDNVPACKSAVIDFEIKRADYDTKYNSWFSKAVALSTSASALVCLAGPAPAKVIGALGFLASLAAYYYDRQTLYHAENMVALAFQRASQECCTSFETRPAGASCTETFSCGGLTIQNHLGKCVDGFYCSPTTRTCVKNDVSSGDPAYAAGVYGCGGLAGYGCHRTGCGVDGGTLVSTGFNECRCECTGVVLIQNDEELLHYSLLSSSEPQHPSLSDFHPDGGVVEAALAAQREEVAACWPALGLAGAPIEVEVSFAPSGKVEALTVADAPSTIVACIQQAIEGVSISPFLASSFTISHKFD